MTLDDRPQAAGADEFETVCQIITMVSGIDRDQLTPDANVGELGIDSLTAAELVVEAEDAFDMNIDFKRVGDDWSRFTLAELAERLIRAGVPR